MGYNAKAQSKYNAKSKTFAVKYQPQEAFIGDMLANAIELSGKSANLWIKEAIKEKLLRDGYYQEEDFIKRD